MSDYARGKCSQSGRPCHQCHRGKPGRQGPQRLQGLRSQQGQALVLGMALTGVAAIVFLRYFALGQVVAAKARQTHALDAAAYSGALIQARALNMLAYINRASAGHQMAMAHLVTLGSWAEFGATQAGALGRGNPPAYLITMLFGPDHGTAYRAASRATGLKAVAESGGRLARAYAAHDDLVRHVFVATQEAIVASLPEARWAAMQAVLARNYPSYVGRVPADSIGGGPGSDFQLTVGDDNWQGFVRRYKGRSLRPFIQTLSGVYDFLSPRNHTASSPWAVDARCPSLRHQLRRRGTTTLDASGRWQSVDTESFHALRANRWIGCYYREYPMGWGWIPSARDQDLGVDHIENPPDNFSAQDFWRWVKEATNWDIFSGDDNPLANSRAVAGRQRWQGGGLAPYFDTAQSDSALRFSLKLRHPGPQGLTVTTRSSAESFFQRPQRRGDGKRETSNLFHPYWQARLAHYPVSSKADLSRPSP